MSTQYTVHSTHCKQSPAVTSAGGWTERGKSDMREQLLPYPKIKVRRLSGGQIALLMVLSLYFMFAIPVNVVHHLIITHIRTKRVKADKAASSARIDALLAGRRERESKRVRADMVTTMRQLDAVVTRTLTGPRRS